MKYTLNLNKLICFSSIFAAAHSHASHCWYNWPPLFICSNCQGKIAHQIKMRLAYFLLIELTTAQRAKMTKLSRVAGFFSSSRKHNKVIEIGKKKQRAKKASRQKKHCSVQWTNPLAHSHAEKEQEQQQQHCRIIQHRSLNYTVFSQHKHWRILCFSCCYSNCRRLKISSIHSSI